MFLFLAHKKQSLIAKPLFCNKQPRRQRKISQRRNPNKVEQPCQKPLRRPRFFPFRKIRRDLTRKPRLGEHFLQSQRNPGKLAPLCRPIEKPSSASWTTKDSEEVKTPPTHPRRRYHSRLPNINIITSHSPKMFLSRAHPGKIYLISPIPEFAKIFQILLQYACYSLSIPTSSQA